MSDPQRVAMYLDEITTLRAEVERLKVEITSLTEEFFIQNNDLGKALLENERLRAYALKAFTVVEFCCGEGFILEPPFYDCDDLLLEGVNLLNVETSEEARAALEGRPQPTPSPWPKGFFKIERSLMDRCTSYNCGQVPSMRLEVQGTGSVYCEPCARKIAAMMEEKP